MPKTIEECYQIRCKDAAFQQDSGLIVSGLELDILPGESIFILSSENDLHNELLYFLAGFKKPIKGEILYRRTNFKRDICFVKHDMIYPSTAIDVVIGEQRCGLFDFSKKKRITAGAEEFLESLGVLECRDTKFSELSVGQRKRVLISRALFSSADTVFLECPTAGIDAVGSEMINKLLKKCGKTVVRSSISLYDAVEYADKILYATKGGYFFGTPAEFMTLYADLA